MSTESIYSYAIRRASSFIPAFVRTQPTISHELIVSLSIADALARTAQGDKSVLVLCEDYSKTVELSSTATGTLYIVVEPHVQATMTFIVTSATNILMHAAIGAHAHLSINTLVLNADTQLSITLSLEGEYAQGQLFDCALLKGKSSYTLNTDQHHRAAYTTSNVLSKGVLAENATSISRGRILIDKTALGSNASQYHKALLLSSQARATATPSLEVLNKQVKCKHGSALAGISQQYVRAVQARGLDLAAARRLMLAGFISDVVPSAQQALVTNTLAEIVP